MAIKPMPAPTRIISANDLHVVTGQFLRAATEIHVAMCLFADEHAAQSTLNKALQNALIGAETCRQIHASAKHRIALPQVEDDEDPTP